MAQQPHTRTTSLGFRSSETDLDEGFAWATQRALEWVQTGSDGAVASYWAGLTDRPMFYSRDVAHQALGAHLLGLDRENLTMLTAFVESATERRKFYPLWAFMFDGSIAAIDYRSDDEFVREVPAVFELVEASLVQHAWTGERAYVEDPRFLSYYRNALTSFVQLHDPQGQGIAGESGTKDIFLGTPSYNESPVGGGMSLAGDAIASQWAALKAVAAHHPDRPFAQWAEAEAHRVAAVFETSWWDRQAGHYLTGFLGTEPISAFAYEASWFPAVKGLIGGERAAAHLDFLSREIAANPPQNIEAFTYLPEAYLSQSHDSSALEWIRFLIASRADYPEVSFTAVAHLTTGLTGLHPLGVDAIETATHLPDGWVDVTNIPFGNRLLDLRHEGTEASVLSVRGEGAALQWTAWNGGRRRDVLVHPGQTVRIGPEVPKITARKEI